MQIIFKGHYLEPDLILMLDMTPAFHGQRVEYLFSLEYFFLFFFIVVLFLFDKTSLPYFVSFLAYKFRFGEIKFVICKRSSLYRN